MGGRAYARGEADGCISANFICERAKNNGRQQENKMDTRSGENKYGIS
jgi:hypothetical protein